MSVDDWARREAEREIESIEEVVRGTWEKSPDFEVRRESFADGIVHAFDALLSDEAVNAAKEAGIRALDGCEQIEDTSGNLFDVGDAISDALQAAIDAVTGGSDG